MAKGDHSVHAASGRHPPAPGVRGNGDRMCEITEIFQAARSRCCHLVECRDSRGVRGELGSNHQPAGAGILNWTNFGEQVSWRVMRCFLSGL